MSDAKPSNPEDPTPQRPFVYVRRSSTSKVKIVDDSSRNSRDGWRPE